MKPIAKSLWVALFVLTACGPTRSPETANTSQLASLTVGEFKPAAGQPQWTDVNVQFDQLRPEQSRIEKTFPQTAFAQGKTEDLELKVPYGDYQLRLTYKGADDKVLYRSCADQDETVHEIKSPEYTAQVKICAENSQDPGGSVDIKPSSAVTITPVPGGTTQPEPTTPTPPTPAPGGGNPGSGLGARLLIGYWHNWDIPEVKYIRLRDVSPAWDVIQIAFAEPASPGSARMNFAPDSRLTTPEQFKSDVAYLQSQGKKVLISIGGANSHLELKTDAMRAEFIESMLGIINTYGFDGLDLDLEGGSFTLAAGDTDFKNPTTPGVKNMIAAVKEIHRRLNGKLLLTMAPETAYVQGGYGNYVNAWGAYLPVIHGLRDLLTFIHVQHYNTGSMNGLDDRAYSQGSADFQVAMAEMLLAGFPVGRNAAAVFPPLRADQVAIGLPAVGPAAPAGGFTSVADVQKAFLYLAKGQSFGGQYTLKKAGGYPALRGLMTWSINWDAKNNFEFSRNHRDFLNRLP
ncbi:chitinase [Oligoflexus tunisiensis]|uniref:chitinase n=1 Tax=Oligoflexus tunisiensis TaxID=708132 RepID=UPI000B03635E|nr:chitinase [Oligoflexus tunisiensis]